MVLIMYGGPMWLMKQCTHSVVLLEEAGHDGEIGDGLTDVLRPLHKETVDDLWTR